MLEPRSLDLPEVTYPPGAAILTEGQRHGEILVLVSGAVRVSSQGTEVAVISAPGAIFGEMAALLDAPATASVTAVDECRFLRSDDPDGLLRDAPGFAREVAVTLARRLDLITGYLVDLRRQYADSGDHLGVVDEVLESLRQHQGPRLRAGSEREPDAPY